MALSTSSGRLRSCGCSHRSNAPSLCGSWSGPTRRAPRSEERRVGKECRSLCDWSSDVCSSDLGALNVIGALEVLRVLAPQQRPVTLRLVDWADEEGARCGRSLFGSSATAGILEPDDVRGLKDKDGVALPDALQEHGVALDRMNESHKQLETAAAYLELHIEQGPVLERMDLPLGIVLGTFGVERHAVRFT